MTVRCCSYTKSCTFLRVLRLFHKDSTGAKSSISDVSFAGGAMNNDSNDATDCMLEPRVIPPHRSTPLPNSDGYIYPLLPSNSRSVRILTVIAEAVSDEPDTTQLHGYLTAQDLDLNPIIPSALSYVWGTREEPFPVIWLNGHSLRITKNCQDALVALRRRFGTFGIWVDTICIDQTSRREQLHQINLMRNIYSQAQTTYIWLESGSAATARAMDHLCADTVVKDLVRTRTTSIFVLCRRWLSCIYVAEVEWFSQYISFRSDEY